MRKTETNEHWIAIKLQMDKSVKKEYRILERMQDGENWVYGWIAC